MVSDVYGILPHTLGEGMERKKQNQKLIGLLGLKRGEKKVLRCVTYTQVFGGDANTCSLGNQE